jgi:N-acetylmuramoyl-L-alanine amidase
MARFLLTYLLHSSILLIFVLLLTRFSVFRRASVRDVLCKVSLLTGVFTALLPSFSINFSTPIALETFMSQPTEVSSTSTTVTNTNLVNDAGSERLKTKKIPDFSWLFWLLGASSILLVAWRFGQALLALRNILSRAQPVTTEELKRFVKQHNVLAKLLSSERVTTPLAVGRRTIVLPQNLEAQFTRAELKDILLHELAHLKRCDPLWNTALSLFSHVFFFQPLNFLLLRTWRQASEELCDAYAVAITSDRAGFAKSLLKMAGRQTHSPRVLTNAMVQQTHLSQRVTALFSKKEQYMKRIYLLGVALSVVVIGYALPVVTVAQVTDKTVVIDAGHGGYDSGAVGFANEAEVVLQVAQKLKGLLESQGITVLMTREDNTFHALEQRTLTVTDETTAYVSIHANTATNSLLRGVETYTFDTSGLSNDKTPNAVRLARLIRESLTVKTGTKDRGIVQGDFYVLRQYPEIAVLVSIGFISNKEEANKLTTDIYQEQIAEGIAEGIMEYLQ